MELFDLFWLTWSFTTKPDKRVIDWAFFPEDALTTFRWESIWWNSRLMGHLDWILFESSSAFIDQQCKSQGSRSHCRCNFRWPVSCASVCRYYTHVKHCKSCSGALANFRAIEVGLQAIAIALVGLVATAAVIPISSVGPLSVPLVAAAVLSTLLSRWVAHFIYRTFYFHDYNHAEIK